MVTVGTPLSRPKSAGSRLDYVEDHPTQYSGGYPVRFSFRVLSGNCQRILIVLKLMVHRDILCGTAL
jgi:hypothetical protein